MRPLYLYLRMLPLSNFSLASAPAQETLAVAYDHVAPCFPPSYAIFETIVALYHKHLAVVVDTLGKRAKALSTKGALRVMEFVRKYMVRGRQHMVCGRQYMVRGRK